MQDWVFRLDSCSLIFTSQSWYFPWNWIFLAVQNFYQSVIIKDGVLVFFFFLSIIFFFLDRKSTWKWTWKGTYFIKFWDLQGVTVYSGKSLSSKFRRNQCLYINKWYTSRKPLISDLIWHPESGRGITRRLSRPLTVEQLFSPYAELCFSRQEGVAPSW